MAAKDELENAFVVEFLELISIAVVFDAAVAERFGLTPVEKKTMQLLVESGPMTPGQLGERLGMASASITGLIGRLERKGCAHRRPHDTDGRRVLVEADADKTVAMMSLQQRAIEIVRADAAEYTPQQLRQFTALCANTIAKYRSAVADIERD